MERMDGLKDELTRILAAKEQRRRQLAAQSFPAKVRALLRLQELAAPILAQRGRRVRPWQIDRPPAARGVPSDI
ncbi:MAG: hypothetical protein ACREXK_04160 [Gammaproteobacteria bacterium]